MDSKRAYQLLLLSSIVLTIAVIGAAFKIDGVLARKSQDLVALKATSAGLSEQKASLVRAKKDVAKYSELYNIAKVVVPENKNQAEAVQQIVNLASNNQVTIGTITFPTSTLGNSTTGAATAPTTTLTTPTKALDPKAALSQLTPVTGASGVYVLAITVASDPSAPASYTQLINFLDALEKNRFTAEVTSVNITPSQTIPGKFSFTLTLNTYIKP